MYSNISEETHEMVELLRQKTTEGFAVFYDRYAQCLFGVICRIVKDNSTAEDILQEVFVKVWRNIDQYDEKKGSLFTWVLKITRYTSIDYLRSRQYKERLKNQTADEIEYIEDPARYSFDSEYMGLKGLVEKLDKKYREVIEMVYLFGYTQEEVSKILGLPLGTIKTRARAGLQILRNQI